MESNKRTRLFQEALNEYPAILHVDGDKKIIGYAFFVLLNIAYLSLPFVFCWHGYGYDETMSLIVLLAICYIPNFAIMFYCLWNRRRCLWNGNIFSCYYHACVGSAGNFYPGKGNGVCMQGVSDRFQS